MALASLPDRYPDLPTPRTSLIGREDGTASVAAMSLAPGIRRLLPASGASANPRGARREY